jgi:hypothetical protein
MKRLLSICLVCVLATAAWGSIDQLLIGFDENGTGFYSVDNGQTQFPLDWKVDGTLYYVLPTQFISEIVPGDVKIMEPDVSGNPTDITSDVLRFTNAQGATGGPEARVYVFSDLPEEGERPPYDLADVGIPTEFQSNVWTMNEEGTENGWNGLQHYVPTSDQPGYATEVAYNFTSDVPEPATIALIGFGALSLLRRKRSV